MQQNYEVIISDASCLIVLDKIGELSLLEKLFGKIVTTPIVANEFMKPLPTWVELRSAKNQTYESALQLKVDKGEASAIALAIEEENPVVILDDLGGRKLAEELNLRFIGTLGIILRAKQIGMIDSIKPIINKMQLTNFRYSEKLFKEILRLANES